MVTRAVTFYLGSVVKVVFLNGRNLMQYAEVARECVVMEGKAVFIVSNENGGRKRYGDRVAGPDLRSLEWMDTCLP